MGILTGSITSLNFLEQREWYCMKTKTGIYKCNIYIQVASSQRGIAS